MAHVFFRLVVSVLVLISSRGAFALEPMAYTVMGRDGQGVLRWITEKSTCPLVHWDSHPGVPMQLRAAQATIVARSSQQIDRKNANFELRSCEAVWPETVKSAQVESIVVAAPATSYQRIVIIADTGCRMKASENAFQDCNDSSAWPYAEIAKRAAEQKPDLVVHIGDIHYRESPCPAQRSGCANSPWGYGADAWKADFFEPSAPLLRVAPWLFVRGNHEVCARAGQGWFRYIDAQPWQENRSCNEPEFDALADYSKPYIFSINALTQFLVFDSSATTGKRLEKTSTTFKNYQRQLIGLDSLLNKNKKTVFLSHHPLLAIAPGRADSNAIAGGNKGLLSVFEEMYQDHLIPKNIDYLMHGHIHAFEALSFLSPHPASFVLGNSGSAYEGVLPETVSAGLEVASGAKVSQFYSHSDYGFSLLEISDKDQAPWKLTAFDRKGNSIFLCELSNQTTRCTRH